MAVYREYEANLKSHFKTVSVIIHCYVIGESVDTEKLLNGRKQLTEDWILMGKKFPKKVFYIHFLLYFWTTFVYCLLVNPVKTFIQIKERTLITAVTLYGLITDKLFWYLHTLVLFKIQLANTYQTYDRLTYWPLEHRN